MKKIIAWICIIMIFLSVTGCGKNNAEKNMVGTWWYYDGDGRITFYENHRFEYVALNIEYSGTWSVDGDELMTVLEEYSNMWLAPEDQDEMFERVKTQIRMFTCSEDELIIDEERYYRSLK